MKDFIHAWEIPELTIVASKRLRGFVRKETDGKVLSLSRKIGVHINTLWFFINHHNKGLPANKYFELMKELGVPLDDAERKISIVRDKHARRTLNIRFPVRITPVLFRLACHLLGDGTIDEWGRPSFIQNNDRMKYFEKILSEKLGATFQAKVKKDRSFAEIDIPKFLFKVVGTSLGLEIRDFKKASLIRTIKNAPHEFQVQLVCALVHDEGHIGPRKRRLEISQKDAAVVSEFCNLLDKLNYNHAQPFLFEKCYKIAFHADGIRRFYLDVMEAVRKHGWQAGLWKKQETFEKLGSEAMRGRLGKASLHVLRRAKIEGIVTINQLKKDPQMIELASEKFDDYIENVCLNLLRYGYLIRVKRGSYTLPERTPTNIPGLLRTSNALKEL